MVRCTCCGKIIGHSVILTKGIGTLNFRENRIWYWQPHENENQPAEDFISVFIGNVTVVGTN